MIGRFFALLVVFSFAVVSITTAAHAARMSDATHYAAQMNHVAAIDTDSGMTCNAKQDCVPGSANICGFVCAGLLGFLFPEPDGVSQIYVVTDYDRAIAPAVSGRSPGLNEPPPKLRLL